MGTNYYLKPKPACPHCGHGAAQGLHIGKSSKGWCFALHVYPDGTHDGEPAPRDLVEWALRFEDGVFDEYGDHITPTEMMAIITSRLVPLQRHQIDGERCIGHGDGTYDLMVGDFS